MNFRHPHFGPHALFAVAGGDGGAGGGGGGTGGTGDDGLDDRIGTAVSKALNLALSGRDRRLLEQIDKRNTDSQTAIGKLLDDKLGKLTTGGGSAGGGDGGASGDGGNVGGGDGKGKRVRTDDPEWSAMKRRQDEMEQTLRAEREKSAKLRQRNIDTTVQSKVLEELAAAGIKDPNQVRAAYATIKLDDRIQTELDEGSESIAVLFRDEDGTSLPLRDGIRSWVKSDSAKIFLPPTGAAGSGGRRAPTVRVTGDGKKREATYEDVGNYVIGLMNPMTPSSGE